MCDDINKIEVWPQRLTAAWWWRHLAEFTVAVMIRRGKRVISLHILTDFMHYLLFFDHVASAYA